MNGVAAAVLAAATLLLTATVAAAQEPPPLEVSATFDGPAATIGDRLTLTLTIRHGDDVVVTPVRPALDGAEVVAIGLPASTLEGGVVVTRVSYVYQVFALGAVTSGPVEVRWLREDGTSGSVEAPGATVTIVSVRAEGDLALRPLKAQATVPGAPPSWLRPAGWTVLGVLALLALGAAWRRWRRRPQEAPAVRMDVPEVEARAELDRLRGGVLATDEAYQRYYGTISAAVRAYLGERFGFNASALTTSELERRMTRHGVDRWQARLVGGLLDRCDDAVYARHYPDPASADHDLTVAYEIVELSRPRQAEEVVAPVEVAS